MKENMLNILAIDTSANWGSVALGKGKDIVYLSYLDLRVTHSERLMLQIDSCLKTTGVKLEEIDLITISNGPGSFTGLRIGLATAKGLCLAQKIPLLPFNSLKILAANLMGLGLNILPMVDAKMNEVYAALYDSNLNELIPPTNSTVEEFLNGIDQPAIIVGDMASKGEERILALGKDFKLANSHQNFPLASSMIGLANKISDYPQYNTKQISELEPYYLRKSQAEVNFG